MPFVVGVRVEKSTSSRLARDTAVMEALVEAERPGAPTPQPATSVSLLPPPASCVCSSSSCAASAAGACPLVPPSALHAAATRAALRSLAADKQTRAIVRAPSAATHAAVPLLPRRRPSSLGVPAHLPVCCRSAAQRPPEGTVLANSCRYAHDGECDEPADGTGKCAAGTDRNDCEAMNSCPYARDGRNRFRGGARVFAGPALTATIAEALLCALAMRISTKELNVQITFACAMTRAQAGPRTATALPSSMISVSSP